MKFHLSENFRPNSPRIITDATDQDGLSIRKNPSHPSKSVVNSGCGFAALRFRGELVFFLSFFAINTFAQQPAPPTLAQLKSQKFSVQTLDGKRVAFDKLLGQGKPVLLDFWATWCGPCRQEIPHLNEIAETYSKDGLIVIGLNLEDPVRERQVVKDFVKELAMKYESVFAPDAIYQFFNPGATGYRIPQTVVFDTKGQLVKRLIGYNANIGKTILNAAVAKAVAK